MENLDPALQLQINAKLIFTRFLIIPIVDVFKPTNIVALSLGVSITDIIGIYPYPVGNDSIQEANFHICIATHNEWKDLTKNLLEVIHKQGK